MCFLVIHTAQCWGVQRLVLSCPFSLSAERGMGTPTPTERGEGGPAQEGCGGVETPTLGWA